MRISSIIRCGLHCGHRGSSGKASVHHLLQYGLNTYRSTPCSWWMAIDVVFIVGILKCSLAKYYYVIWGKACSVADIMSWDKWTGLMCAGWHQASLQTSATIKELLWLAWWKVLSFYVDGLLATIILYLFALCLHFPMCNFPFKEKTQIIIGSKLKDHPTRTMIGYGLDFVLTYTN